MALTNEDIDERFELDAERVIRWRRVSAKGLPRWCQAKADEINRKAGEAVNFFEHTSGPVVKVYGGMVAESRIRKVLQRQTARDVAEVMARAARKRAKRAAVKAAPKASGDGGRPWDDPTDPKPDGEDKAALEAWGDREYSRAMAWRRQNGND